ncbi:MAG: universal stress protein [Devosia sp.]
MIKDILVRLSGSDQDNALIEYASSVARQFDAHLTGLYVHVMPEVLGITDPTGSSFLQELIADTANRSLRHMASLQERFATLDVRNDLRRVELYPHEVVEVLAFEARAADLFIDQLPYGDASDRGGEAVLFGSGHACLFIPADEPVMTRFATIAVGSNGSRESARAIEAAIPFMAAADTVIVIAVAEAKPAALQPAIEADIGRYLSRHGIAAEVRTVASSGPPGSALLGQAVAAGADMLVIGGYGHSRWRELVLGGTTRHILSKSPIPVLAAH